MSQPRKATYKLTIPATTPIITNDDGSRTIVLESEIDEQRITDARDSDFDEFSGECQNGMLWEKFEHDFYIEGCEAYYEY